LQNTEKQKFTGKNKDKISILFLFNAGVLSLVQSNQGVV
jgi:hypothetical protein